MKTVESRQVEPIISNYGSHSETHICGDAEFPDGKRYRFVIVDKLMKHMYLYEGAKYSYSKDFASRASQKALAIYRAAMPLIPDALAAYRANCAKEDAERAAQNAKAHAEHLVREAAPALLEACRADLHDLQEIRNGVDGLNGDGSIAQARELRRITDLIDGRLNGLHSAISLATNNATKE